jgi:esterase/lipase superfamily enzyme
VRREYHHWISERIGRDVGMLVYGHWGQPILLFPTSGGDHTEAEQQGLIDALEEFIDAGRVKVYSLGSVNAESFYNRQAHPFHRSYMQSQFDQYIRHEVMPFVEHDCQTAGIAMTTAGASFGAYHAANSLFKHPHLVKRCFALSGLYDLRRFMDGLYDDNFYFNNPVDYLANLSDPSILAELATCDIHIATGTGPWEHREWSDELSAVLTRRGIRHSLDDWGPDGGHDWLYWNRQMREYVGRYF